MLHFVAGEVYFWGKNLEWRCHAKVCFIEI